MTKVPMSTFRRLISRASTAAVAASLVATGLLAPSAPTDSRAVIADKVQTLTQAVANKGWSKAADTGHPTELVGFEWQGNHDGAVEVRARQGKGWTDWQRVEGDPTEGPDPTSKEHHPITTAGPVWVGRGVRQVEVRVAEGALGGLKLHALRSEEPQAASGTKPAGATPAQPGIVSRASWGADESFRSLNPGCGTPEYADNVRFSVVHHTVNTNNYSPADSASLIRGIYYFHTHTNKWCDIGYNFLVDRFGTVFEGRYGGITRAVVGAHALNFNTGSTGVALLGTFQTDPVPSAMYASLRSLLAWKLAIHNVDPTAVISYNGASVNTVSGHRDLNPTECPGDMPYGMLPQLRKELAGLVAGGPRYNVRSVGSGKLMDVYGASTSAGASVIQWPPNGGANQQWQFVDLGNGNFEIVSVNSGLLLDVYGASTAAGAQVIQWPRNGGRNQQWQFVDLGNGNVEIVSVNSGLVLDVYGASTADGAPLIQWPWHGGPNQQWARPAA
ncbi:MAG: RICIN domain-containing protein [Acidimicrobiales bacterium]